MNELIDKIQALVLPLISDTDMFITNIRIKPVNNIKLFLESDSGFSIEKSILVNKKLYPVLESSGLFPGGDFSLEVSSPGVDEPLVLVRQYIKNTGRKLCVTLADGTEKTGLLKVVSDDQITLEVKLPKQKEPVTMEIPFTNIKQSIVQIIF